MVELADPATELVVLFGLLIVGLISYFVWLTFSEKGQARWRRGTADPSEWVPNMRKDAARYSWWQKVSFVVGGVVVFAGITAVLGWDWSSFIRMSVVWVAWSLYLVLRAPRRSSHEPVSGSKASPRTSANEPDL